MKVLEFAGNMILHLEHNIAALLMQYRESNSKDLELIVTWHTTSRGKALLSPPPRLLSARSVNRGYIIFKDAILWMKLYLRPWIDMIFQNDGIVPYYYPSLYGDSKPTENPNIIAISIMEIPS